MFGICPWNLNSSVLVNSAAERQAQKRKIRNGQLPMPKLIKTSKSNDVFRLPKCLNSACPSISDSLLPDTVVISEDNIKGENELELSKESWYIPCGIPKHLGSSSVENDICSTAVIDTPKRCSFEVSESSKNFSAHVRSTAGVSDHEVPQVSGETTTLRNYVCKRGFIDLNDSKLLRKICLEGGDGFVLKLGCSEGSTRVLTVVQEYKITFWESPLLFSGQQLSWFKKASIPISMSFVQDQGPLRGSYTNELLLELGLCPSRWTSVVLIVDPDVSKGSVYGCDILGSTKVINNLLRSPLANKKHKKLYSCLLDSSTLVIWCHNEGKGTTLKKFLLLDDLDQLVEENEFVGIESNIQSLHHIDTTKPVVVGIDQEFQLFMWNHTTGNVIKSIDLFSSEIHSCIGIKEDKGFLFIIANGKPGSVHLLAINISTKKWMVLKTYTRTFKESVSGYTIDDDLLLAAYQDGIVVWDMEKEIELSCYLPQKQCVPYVFSRDTVFMTNDHRLYILDNLLIFKMQRGNQ